MKNITLILVMIAISTGFLWGKGRDEEIAQNRDDAVIWVANGMEDNLSLIDPSGYEVITTIETGINPHILSKSPDGKLIFVINAGAHDRDTGKHGEKNLQNEKTIHGKDPLRANSLWVYDSGNGSVVAKVPVGKGPTHPIPSNSGLWVYVTNTDENSISVISTRDWQVVKTIEGIPEPHDGAITPDDTMLYIAASGDRTLTVIDTVTNEVINRVPVGVKPRGVVSAGSSGHRVFVSNKSDGTINVIDILESDALSTIDVGAGPHSLVVSADGEELFVALSEENSIAVVDWRKGEVKSRIPVGTTPEQLVVGNDGSMLYSSNNGDDTITVIDLKSGKAIATVETGKGAYGIEASTFDFGRRATGLPELEQNRDGYAVIDVNALSSALDLKDFTLINVHIPFQGNIPGTDANIPFNDMDEIKQQYPDKNGAIVVYCRSGSMSRAASRELADLGYSNVIDLKGGTNAWLASGRSLEK